jgi:hypothetical protein
MKARGSDKLAEIDTELFNDNPVQGIAALRCHVPMAAVMLQQ